jgi:hypothetical protein
VNPYGGSRKTPSSGNGGRLLEALETPALAIFYLGAIYRNCWRVSWEASPWTDSAVLSQKPVRNCGRGAFCSKPFRHRNDPRAVPSTGLECQHRYQLAEIESLAGDRTKSCMQVVTTTIVRVSAEARELALAVKSTYSFHLS